MSRFLSVIFLSWIFLPVLFAPNIATAQTSATLLQGQRVRVAYRCKVARGQVVECGARRSPRVDTGYLQAVDGHTLRVRGQSTDTELAIPTAFVDKVWVVDGKKGNFWAGAGIGLVAGAAVGGVIGSTQEFCILGCSPATEIGFILGAPAGFLVGGLVGALIQSDRWQAVGISGVHTSLEPRLNGIGVTVSVSF